VRQAGLPAKRPRRKPDGEASFPGSPAQVD
jgi:hypothetical protein